MFFLFRKCNSFSVYSLCTVNTSLAGQRKGRQMPFPSAAPTDGHPENLGREEAPLRATLQGRCQLQTS